MPDPQPTNRYKPVTFMMVIGCHSGLANTPLDHHLFEMDCDCLPLLGPGLLLKNIPGMPKVAGQDADFDNEIVRVIVDGARPRPLVQVHGFRRHTETVEEVAKQLSSWTHVRKLTQASDADLVTNSGTDAED